MDLQFFVAGKLHSAMTKEYTGIRPKDIGTLKFKVSETVENYVVTVKISKANANNFATYMVFKVDGQAGTYAVSEVYAYTSDSQTNPSTPSPLG